MYEACKASTVVLHVVAVKVTFLTALV